MPLVMQIPGFSIDDGDISGGLESEHSGEGYLSVFKSYPLGCGKEASLVLTSIEAKKVQQERYNRPSLMISHAARSPLTSTGRTTCSNSLA